jgi:hypothetical protein
LVLARGSPYTLGSQGSSQEKTMKLGIILHCTLLYVDDGKAKSACNVVVVEYENNAGLSPVHCIQRVKTTCLYPYPICLSIVNTVNTKMVHKENASSYKFLRSGVEFCRTKSW